MHHLHQQIVNSSLLQHKSFTDDRDNGNQTSTVTSDALNPGAMDSEGTICVDQAQSVGHPSTYDRNDPRNQSTTLQQSTDVDSSVNTAKEPDAKIEMTSVYPKRKSFMQNLYKSMHEESDKPEEQSQNHRQSSRKYQSSSYKNFNHKDVTYRYRSYNKTNRWSSNGSNANYRKSVHHRSNRSKDSTEMLTKYQDAMDLGNESNLSADSGDLDKLQMMTAIDFNRDRYARYGVHESEMKDRVRTETYQDCFKYCTNNYIKDKVVLIIRCGIGLLPMLCVSYGKPKIVIALEQSACIEYARRIIKDNMYCDRITLIQSSVQELRELPHGLSQVDVIVSDFLGECVLGQGDQIEQVIEARDRFLKPNGLMIPMCVSLYAQLSEQRRAYENQRIRKKKTKPIINHKYDERDQPMDTDYNTDSSSDSTLCSWWSDVYGFDMRSHPEFIVDHNTENDNTNQKWCVMAEPISSYFNPNKVVSDACLIKEFDMHKCTIDEVRYVNCKDLKLNCITPFTSSNGGDYAHMLELFMNVEFPNGRIPKSDKPIIGFSTSSESPYTRYKQTGLLLRDQLLVEEGNQFILDEFIMIRGPNGRNKLFEKTSKKSEYEDNLKLRLRYTFVNKYIKAINRRCAYTVNKYLC